MLAQKSTVKNVFSVPKQYIRKCLYLSVDYQSYICCRNAKSSTLVRLFILELVVLDTVQIAQ